MLSQPMMKYIIVLCILAQSMSYAQHAQQQQQNYQQAPVNYRPFSQAPAGIKQLLQFQQAREPLVNIPAQPPPNLGPAQQTQPIQTAQGQLSQYQPQVQYGQAPQQPNYKNQPAAFASQYRPQQSQGSTPQQYPQQPQQYQG